MNRFLEVITRIEDITNSDPIMKYLCKSIRNHPDTRSNLESITRVLEIVRMFLEIVIEVAENEVQRNSISRDFANMTFKLINEKNLIDTDHFVLEFRNRQMRFVMRQQFTRINPHIDTSDVEEILGDKDLIDMLEDVYNVSLHPNEEEFIFNLDGVKFGRAVNVGEATYERLTPNPEYRNNNRWNPREKFYSYLGVNREGNVENLIHTCLEEIRCTADSEYTFCEFELREPNMKFLDLSMPYYQSENLQNYMDSYLEEGAQEVSNYLTTGETDRNEIEELVNVNVQKFRSDLERKLAKEFLYYIVTEVFIPLDKYEDTEEELKTRAYASFHKLADWLETKYDGVIYPSTRMKMMGNKGECCVLFKHEKAKPVHESKKTGVKV